MPQDDYERYRKRLEEQLHSDIGLLYEAFHAKLQAYKTILRSRRGELDLDPGLQAASGASPAPAPEPLAATVPAPPTLPPPWSEPMVDTLRKVLPALPEEFDKSDVFQALGWTPRRSTYYGGLQQLEREGLVKQILASGGKRAAIYRKVDQGSS